jgi:hypothetical protein
MLSIKQAKRMVTKARRRHRKASGRAGRLILVHDTTPQGLRLLSESRIALTKAYDRLFKVRHPPVPCVLPSGSWVVEPPDILADLEAFVTKLRGKRLDTSHLTSTP